jgi:hypothetical protein
MVPIVPKDWQAFKPSAPIAWHYPTSGKSCPVLGMGGIDTRAIVAANLRALMDYAKAHGHPELASVKGVAKAAGVERYTIDGMLDGIRNTGIQTLQKVAEAFGTQAWVLLTPHAKPGNLPVKPVTRTEVQLYKRLGNVAREYEQHMREQRAAESPGSTNGPDTETPGARSNGARDRNPGED